MSIASQRFTQTPVQNRRAAFNVLRSNKTTSLSRMKARSTKLFLHRHSGLSVSGSYRPSGGRGRWSSPPSATGFAAGRQPRSVAYPSRRPSVASGPTVRRTVGYLARHGAEHQVGYNTIDLGMMLAYSHLDEQVFGNTGLSVWFFVKLFLFIGVCLLIIDARQLAWDAELEADVCVVGAGPIGISIAQRLGRAGLSVILLDAGGMDFDPAANARGEPETLNFDGVARLGHTRQVGGNANAWLVRTSATNRGVRLLPFIDAEMRAVRGHDASDWPVRQADLQSYYRDASAILCIGDDRFSPEDFGTPDEGLLSNDPELRTGVFRFGNGGEFVKTAIRDLRSSAKIRLLHHATVVEVLTNDTGTLATGVRVVPEPGREMIVRAPQIVLASGCMAVTQLLLASDAVRAAGLGNDADLLGRNLMDHPVVAGGTFYPSSPAIFRRCAMYDMRNVGGRPAMGYLQLNDDVLDREDLLNQCMLIFPRTEGLGITGSARQQRGVTAALDIREALIRRRMPLIGDLRAALLGIDGVVRRQTQGFLNPQSSLGRGGWSQRQAPEKRFTHFDVLHPAEEAPHPDNRIILGQGRDAYGLRKIVVQSSWHHDDKVRTMKAQRVFARALARLGWGDYQIAEDGGMPVMYSRSSSHFMGTTRMNASPKLGVVDEAGAVHGTPNIYVASSSIFPRGGFANVTLTALAMGLRTADAMMAARKP